MKPKHATTFDVQDLIKFSKIGRYYSDFPTDFHLPLLTEPGYVPSFKGYSLVASAIICSILLIIVVPLRLVLRSGRGRRAWGLDDTLIIPASLLALTINALDLYEVYVGGIGYHAYDLEYGQLKLVYLLQFVHLQLYFWATLLTKLSICYFALRLQPSKATQFSRGLIAFMVLLPCLTIISTFLLVFNYRPIRAAWDLEEFTGHVVGGSLPNVLFWISVVYTLTDFIVWMIPIPIIVRLQMSLRKKLGLIALFGVGLGVCIIVAIRTSLIRQALLTYDGTWKGANVLMLNQLEACLGIVVASLPAINAKVYSMLSGCWTRVTTKSRSTFPWRNRDYEDSIEKGIKVQLEGYNNHSKMHPPKSPTDLVQVKTEFTISEERHGDGVATPEKSYLPQAWRNRNIIEFTTRASFDDNTTFQPDYDQSTKRPFSTESAASGKSLQLTIQGAKTHDSVASETL